MKMKWIYQYFKLNHSLGLQIIIFYQVTDPLEEYLDDIYRLDPDAAAFLLICWPGEGIRSWEKLLNLFGTITIQWI